MTYAKPEVAVLGNASSVIESIAFKTQSTNDFGQPFPNPAPAYDLDE